MSRVAPLTLLVVAVACGGRTSNNGTADSGSAPPCTATASVLAVTAGERDTCAIAWDHRVWCWGTNAEGQVGDGTMTGMDCPDFQPCHPSPTLVASLSSATAIAARWEHVCAIVGDGTVWCWGSNAFAEAGDGTTTGVPCLDANATGCKPTPVQVVSIHDAISIAAGFGHNCVIRSGGVVSCWGEDGAGEVGDAMKTTFACNGVVPCVPTPFDVTSLGTGVKAIAAGTFDTCAIKSDDTLWCWGSNEFGSLGDGTTNGSLVPVEVPIGSVSAVSMGFNHACAIKTDGTLWCWGRNDGGELGDGTTTGVPCSFTVCRPSPIPVAALGANVRAVYAGDYSTCALTSDGVLWCWGDGSLDQPSPTQVTTDVVTAAVGTFHACAIHADNTLQCWGESALGELGTNASDSDGGAAPVAFCN